MYHFNQTEKYLDEFEKHFRDIIFHTSDELGKFLSILTMISKLKEPYLIDYMHHEFKERDIGFFLDSAKEHYHWGDLAKCNLSSDEQAYVAFKKKAKLLKLKEEVSIWFKELINEGFAIDIVGEPSSMKKIFTILLKNEYIQDISFDSFKISLQTSHPETKIIWIKSITSLAYILDKLNKSPILIKTKEKSFDISLYKCDNIRIIKNKLKLPEKIKQGDINKAMNALKSDDFRVPKEIQKTKELLEFLNTRNKN